MKYSSFCWLEKRKRGWIFGPFRGHMLTIIRFIPRDEDIEVYFEVRGKCPNAA